MEKRWYLRVEEPQENEMVRTKNRQVVFCEERPKGRSECGKCVLQPDFFSGINLKEKFAMVMIDCPLELELTLKKGKDF